LPLGTCPLSLLLLFLARHSSHAACHSSRFLLLAVSLSNLKS
jgi:hypothetical protein